MKSKLTTALTLLLALVFVVSSFAGCANGGEGTESGSASGSDASDSGSETSEIANTKEELGKVDWGGKEFGILLYDGFSGEVKAEDGVVDKEGGNSQVINDAVYTRNNLLESECGLKFNWGDQARRPGNQGDQHRSHGAYGRVLPHRLPSARNRTGGNLRLSA